MKKILWPVLLLGLSFNAAAQTADSEEGPDGDFGPPRWSLGIAAVFTDSPYAGEGTRVLPVPLIFFNGERFFFRGLGGGYKIIENDSFELSAVAKGRMDGFKVKDLGRTELARNGIDYRLLEDRDNEFDVGLNAKWKGWAGELEAELLADASNKSGGQEATFEYGYPIELGRGSLTPQVGVTWQSKDMANYFYGTLDEEVARGVVDYKPGAVTTPHAGISYFAPFAGKWSVLASAKYSALPDELKASPLLEKDTDSTVSFFLGFSRGF